MPLSASMSAPASIANSLFSGSFTTDAVRPAAVEALPVVYTARGRKRVCASAHGAAQGKAHVWAGVL
eukprot:scaffold294367_cov14-Tisochrysis_lutea.AAC.1